MNVTDNLALMIQSFSAQATQNKPPSQRTEQQGEGGSFRELMQQKQPASKAQAPKQAAANRQPDATVPQENPSPDVNGTIPSLELLAIPFAGSPLLPASDPQVITQDTLPASTPIIQLPAQQGFSSAPQAEAQLLSQPQQLRPTIEAQPKNIATTPQPAQSAPKTESAPPPVTAQQTSSEDGEKSPAGRQTAPPAGQNEVTAKQSDEALAQPLFRQLEGTPVKVANPQTLDTETPDFTNQLAKKVDTALQNGLQKIEISLNPAHLGKLTIELTRAQDGSVRMVLFTATERAANLLSEHAGSLSALLRGNVQAAVQVEIQQQQPGERENQQQQQHGQQQQKDQPNKQETQDFLQQLRLGMIPLESEAS